jgi:hypothetical protein
MTKLLRLLVVVSLGTVAFEQVASGQVTPVESKTKLEQLVRRQEIRVASNWVTLPKVSMGVLGNGAGEITVRAGVVVSGTDEARGIELRIDTANDDTASVYIDEDELQGLIDSIDGSLIKTENNAHDHVRQISYETRGRFRASSDQRAGNEPEYQFMIFVPISILVGPRDVSASVTASVKGKTEWRSDGSVGILVPVLVTSKRTEAAKVIALLTSARETLKSVGPNKSSR